MASSTTSLSSSLSLPLRASFQGGSTLSWPCPTRPSLVLLFIPGNPGVVDYYTPYLDAIYHSRECAGSVEILAVGHRGHTALEETSEEERGASVRWQKEGTGLQAQVRHKIEVVKAIRKAYPRSDSEDDDDVKIIIVGHSVGAWIGLRVLEEMGDDIDGLQLLFPTVMNIAQTPKARTLPLLLLTSPLLPGLFLPPLLLFVSLIPSVLLLAVAGFVSSIPSPALKATFGFITTPSAPLNASLMARDEFLTIKGLTPSMASAVKKLRERGGTLRSYWSRGDEDSWAPSRSRDELEQAIGLVRIKLPANVYSSPSDISATLGKGDSSTSKSSMLHSRTLQVGSLTRAAGRRIARGYQGGSPMGKNKSSPASPATQPPPFVFPQSHSQSPRMSRASHSHSSVPLTQQQQADAREAGTTSPIASTSSPLRKRTIPMTSSGRRRPSINLAKARRSFDGSITLELPEGQDWDYLQQGNGDSTDFDLPQSLMEEDEGYSNGDSQTERGQGSKVFKGEDDLFFSQPASSSSKSGMTLGTGGNGGGGGGVLYSSPGISPMDVHSANSPSKQLGGVPASAQAPSTPVSASSAAAAAGGGGRKHKKHPREPRAEEAMTSTVCELGMPHAFCLRYGPQMGAVSARWLGEDWL